MRTPLLDSIDELARRIDFMRAQAESIGRTAPLDVCFHPFSLTDHYDAEAVCEELAQLAQLGVTWCVLSVPSARTRSEYLDHASRFADSVMARTRG